MSNSIIIPIIVIIICFVIVYGILSYRYNRKLINTIESFQTNLQIKNLNQFQSSLSNNTEITAQIANGSWTTCYSTVDSNYNIKGNNMVIDINSKAKQMNNYGTISFTIDGNVVATSTISSLLNGCIEASGITYLQTTNNPRSRFNPSFNIFIEFVGLTDKDKKEQIQSEVYYVNTTQMAIVSYFYNSTLMIKFASYKYYNDQVDSSIYGIIISKSFYINNPPEIYDYDTYNVIVNSYKFPSNPISFNFSNNNDSTILNTIKTNYLGNISFCIQRVFNTPTGNEIITNISPKITVSAIQNSYIPDNIEIVPLSYDQSTNNLESFFKPISTIVYFYKFQGPINSTYGYKNTDPIIHSSSVMQFQNNSPSMFDPSIQYQHIDRVYQDNIFQYNIQYLTTISSYMDQSSFIDFSILSQLL